MITTKGKRGRSKADVQLSVDVTFGSVIFHVWEDGKITHTFTAGSADFLNMMKIAAEAGLQENQRLKEALKDVPHCRTDL